MKNLFLSLIMLCGLCLFSNNSLQAQDRLAYVNTAELLTAMQEYKAAEKQLEDFTLQKENQIKREYESLQQSAMDLQKRVEVIQDITQAQVQEEQQKLMQREQEIQQAALDAEIAVAQRQQELLTPIQDKAINTINVVAKELGYNYVIDASTGVLLAFPPGSDITQQVKARL